MEFEGRLPEIREEVETEIDRRTRIDVKTIRVKREKEDSEEQYEEQERVHGVRERERRLRTESGSIETSRYVDESE